MNSTEPAPNPPEEPTPEATAPPPEPVAAPSAPAEAPPPTLEPVAPPSDPVVVPVNPDTPSAPASPVPEPTPSPAVPALPPQPVPTVPAAPQSQDLSRIAQDLQIRKVQVEAVVALLDEANTVPFITRYRKERTGGLDEDMIRRVQTRVGVLRTMAERKQTILKSIAGQGRLNDDLVKAILDSDHPKRLEDLYLPYKPKKRSLASDAKEKGLEPLAVAIWTRDPAVDNLQEVLPGLVNPEKKLHTVEEVTAGVRHILAEIIAELADVRGPLRLFLRDTAVIVTSKADGVPEGKGSEYRDYFQFKEPVRMMPPHRILAVNRGEHEKIIRSKLEWDGPRAKDITLRNLPLADHPHREFLFPVVEDALDRLVLPGLEREIRREMSEFAQEHGVEIFARNLKSLLLRAPLGSKTVLAIDPGMRTGCKVAVLGPTGDVLEDGVIYPHPPENKVAEAKRKLEQLIRKHSISIVAIGNGTGCRETEQIVADLIADFEERRINPRPAQAVLPDVAVESHPISAEHHVSVTSEVPASVLEAMPSTTTVDVGVLLSETVTAGVTDAPGTTTTETPSEPATPSVQTPTAPATPPKPAAPKISLEGLGEAPADLAYVIVNEAGASDYSASPIAKEEFPDLDATARGTISIGRRLQDPLAELVKIDPQHVGVGLYQHDIRPKHLKESLEAVIESCVNAVGVDVNTASIPLLRHVSGLNQLVAREIVEYRKKNGPFKSREALKSVPQMGEARFTQAAGFLKIRDGAEPLDNTWVHPESYPIAQRVLTGMEMTATDLADKTKLADIGDKLRAQNPEAIANEFKVGGPTVRDIFDAIARPGRDIREDRPLPIFRKGVLKLEDLKPGMELKGEILNVVDFGAFVDVGLKDSGLIHISQMANRFIKSPYDVVSVGDVVPVWVMTVDGDRKRVSLSMIQPGQERKPPEPRERQPMRDRPSMQPRDQGPPRDQGQQRPAGDRGGFQPRHGGPPQQGQGQGRGPGGPGGGRQFPPRGPRPGGPPQPMQHQPPAQPLPPPKPSKPKPLPKLSTDQKQGKAALNTFAQLAAFFKPPEEPKPAEAPKAAEEAPTQETHPPAAEGHGGGGAKAEEAKAE